MKERLVIIGNGMAPGRMLEKLFELAPDRYQITIFNAEPRVNYDRIMLSPVLSGEKSYEEIVIHGDGWYIRHEIMLHKGVRVTQIDRAAKTITTNTGHVEPYDKLVRPLPDMREAAVRLVTQAVKEQRRAYVLVNNRSEGHAPGTVKAIRGMLMDDQTADAP